MALILVLFGLALLCPRLLRVLVPSWQFFAEPGEVFSLWYRVEEGPWQPCDLGPRPAFWLNAPGLLNLACQDVVHGLTHDATSLDHHLTCNVVRRFAPPGRLVQFKVCADDQDVIWSSPFLT